MCWSGLKMCVEPVLTCHTSDLSEVLYCACTISHSLTIPAHRSSQVTSLTSLFMALLALESGRASCACFANCTGLAWKRYQNGATSSLHELFAVLKPSCIRVFGLLFCLIHIFRRRPYTFACHVAARSSRSTSVNTLRRSEPRWT